ncbi:MAG: hypothetical protein Q8K65_08840 [Alphaproteobacteria bacterium]|nr:hypothetical protein [Alphaproteobacteria bacterium]
MTDIIWPEDLPQSPLLDGLQETLPDNLLRTKMEQGSSKLRRRGTDAPAKITAQFLLDAAQCAVLDSFYADTLAGGVRRFGFTHPRHRDAVSCRIAQPPEYAALNGGYFRARLTLEVLP